ncbi:DNA polymerase III subunit delta' [Limosilactobacillus secaliphilus]|uniref:DNA polymerase III n=1 Tax=Limosilactobacillus secaliphilus TaxID=396268 RepID=A0A0R2ID83_9LACO|nr:DNA polymerase III subunit delta' [Limosilactobacillus secaliphilus]KRN59565.1 DNA polymerase III [Limosilactobacillus secaliphilus]
MPELKAEKLQPTILHRFQQVIAHHELAHAYLLVGPDGAGKQELAQWLTLMLFCRHVTDGRPDLTCPECQRVLSGNHPDVVVAKAEGRQIKVDQVRHLKAEFTKSGMEGQRKVFIIEDADKLTTGAANSLLKFIEEPGPGIYIFMLSNNKNAVLPTIQSRTQIVEMQPLSPDSLAQQLTTAGVPQELQPIVTGLTDSVTEAQSWMQDDWLKQVVANIVRWFKETATGNLESFVDIQESFVPLVSGHDREATCLDLMSLIWRDALVIASHADGRLYYQHYQSTLQAALRQLSVDQVLAASHIALTSRKLLDQNISFQNVAEQETLRILKETAHL